MPAVHNHYPTGFLQWAINSQPVFTIDDLVVISSNKSITEAVDSVPIYTLDD